jgi:cysteine desulfurase
VRLLGHRRRQPQVLHEKADLKTATDSRTDQVIYLDHQATTPVDPRVLDAMLPYLTSGYGNPSSLHAYGRQAAEAIRVARNQLRELIAASTESEVVFTSGATEADCLAITGIARALKGVGHHIITTAIEHKAVLASCRRLAEEGFQVTIIPVKADGLVNPADIAAAITPGTVLVSVMHANNEIGTIQPLAEIGNITREHGVLLHTDAAQSLGSLAFHVDHLGVDLASFSGHKIYGPKGVGALYVRRGKIRPVPHIVGGGQEYGLRPGTLNVPGIVGIGQAAAILAEQRHVDTRRIADLRDQLLAMLGQTVSGVRLNGSLTRRLPGNLNITIPGIEADQLVDHLPGLAISTGSACSTGQPDPSHVLTAIGLDRSSARSSIRIGLGRSTTLQDIISAVQQISGAVRSSTVTVGTVAGGSGLQPGLT